MVLGEESSGSPVMRGAEVELGEPEAQVGAIISVTARLLMSLRV